MQKRFLQDTYLLDMESWSDFIIYPLALCEEFPQPQETKSAIRFQLEDLIYDRFSRYEG